MHRLESVLTNYADYHRHPFNHLLHVVGIPVIVFSSLGLLGPVAGAVAVALLSLYYLWLDLELGAVLTLVLAVLWAGVFVAGAPWTLYLALFVGGWGLQFWGHWVEGKRPALVDNFTQIFSAPAFLAAKGLFTLGWRKELARRVKSKPQP